MLTLKDSYRLIMSSLVHLEKRDRVEEKSISPKTTTGTGTKKQVPTPTTNNNKARSPLGKTNMIQDEIAQFEKNRVTLMTTVSQIKSRMPTKTKSVDTIKFNQLCEDINGPKGEWSRQHSDSAMNKEMDESTGAYVTIDAKFAAQRFVNPMTREETFRNLFYEVNCLNDRVRKLIEYYDKSGNFLFVEYLQSNNRLSRQDFDEIKQKVSVSIITSFD